MFKNSPRSKRLHCTAKKQMLATGFVLLIVAGCAQIPKNPHRPVSYSLTPATAGVLTETRQAVLEKTKDGASAFMLIQNNADALRWRLALIDHATESIDLQVFIWSSDESGHLILNRLIHAAERGVQIRLLVDDMIKDWSDNSIALIARIPNIQLRRFNPGRVRKGTLQRMFQMSTQFRTLNRRMHNKQMVVDGQWAIIGGRNIGNPYFGLSKKYNNRDLDLLTTGAVIQEMAENFDEYWNADTAYPGEAMSDGLSKKKVKKISRQLTTEIEKSKALLVQADIPVDPINWSAAFSTLPNRMVTGTAKCLQDSPTVTGDRGIRLIDQIIDIDFNVQHQSVLITPYMIPSQDQIDAIRKGTQNKNTRTRILVPSMESNNHTMAHSHYRKHRKKLLKAGAELYEFKGEPSAAIRKESDTAPVESKFISLHTKAFVLDRNWVLLGSLNMDPRSIKINTEHILIIDCPELAEQLLADFETMTASENAWAVTLNQRGKLRWVADDKKRKTQPAQGFTQRCKDFFYRWLPIEGLL